MSEIEEIKYLAGLSNKLMESFSEESPIVEAPGDEADVDDDNDEQYEIDSLNQDLERKAKAIVVQAVKTAGIEIDSSDFKVFFEEDSLEVDVKLSETADGIPFDALSKFIMSGIATNPLINTYNYQVMVKFNASGVLAETLSKRIMD